MYLKNANDINFKYDQNFPSLGHGIYAMNIRKSCLVSSHDQDLNKRYILGFNP